MMQTHITVSRSAMFQAVCFCLGFMFILTSTSGAAGPDMTEVHPLVSEGVGFVRVRSRWHMIDVNGEEIAQLKDYIDEIETFMGGMARCRVGDRYGFIDRTGEIVISAGYSAADSFYEGVAAVAVSSAKPGEKLGRDVKWGFIKPNGEFAILPQYQEAGSFTAGFAPASENGKWGFIDRRGVFHIKPQFDDVHNFFEGLAAVRMESKWGYIQTDGQFRIKPRFLTASPFNEGWATVTLPLGEGTNWFNLVDAQGKFLFKNEKAWCGNFTHGRVPAMAPGNFAMCQPDGRSGKSYLALREYREGLAAVMIQSKPERWGFMDLAENLVIAAEYEAVYPFSHGVAFVKKSGKWLLIDKAGAVKWAEPVR